MIQIAEASDSEVLLLEFDSEPHLANDTLRQVPNLKFYPDIDARILSFFSPFYPDSAKASQKFCFYPDTDQGLRFVGIFWGPDKAPR